MTKEQREVRRYCFVHYCQLCDKLVRPRHEIYKPSCRNALVPYKVWGNFYPRRVYRECKAYNNLRLSWNR